MSVNGFKARRRRRLTLAVLSALTAVWLLSQLYVSANYVTSTWPVAAYGMFASGEGDFVRYRLDARSRAGRELVLTAEDFGMTRKTLNSYLNSEIANRRWPPRVARQRLAQVAAAWNERRDSDPVVRLTLVRELHQVPDGRVLERSIARWETP